jgi:hypothetical protein
LDGATVANVVQPPDADALLGPAWSASDAGQSPASQMISTSVMAWAMAPFVGFRAPASAARQP